jgi:peptidyl-tRNA hydrolase, PTH1 family
METKDFIIVGLGNPGEQYRSTRHNVGFFVVDELVRRWNTTISMEKWQAKYVSLSVKKVKVHLVKPITFMNRSGIAVDNFARFFKVSPDHLLVVHDDLDMAPGRIKLVKGGGTGGHNGIKSLVEVLGTKDFFRLKIGIGRPGNGVIHPGFPVDKYVLSSFSDEDLHVLQFQYDSLEEGICLFLQGDSARAMNILNSLK